MDSIAHQQNSILLTQTNVNPSMDKLPSVRYNYVSIPKFQRLYH